MRSGAVSALERRGLETLLERAALTLWNQDNPPRSTGQASPGTPDPEDSPFRDLKETRADGERRQSSRSQSQIVGIKVPSRMSEVGPPMRTGTQRARSEKQEERRASARTAGPPAGPNRREAPETSVSTSLRRGIRGYGCWVTPPVGDAPISTKPIRFAPVW